MGVLCLISVTVMSWISTTGAAWGKLHWPIWFLCLLWLLYKWGSLSSGKSFRLGHVDSAALKINAVRSTNLNSLFYWDALYYCHVYIFCTWNFLHFFFLQIKWCFLFERIKVYRLYTVLLHSHNIQYLQDNLSWRSGLQNSYMQTCDTNACLLVTLGIRGPGERFAKEKRS